MADLSAEKIAQEGLALIDEKGADAFSLRAVAQRLGVTPMAIYHHVNGKAELASLVVDFAMKSTPLTELSEDWREALWQIACWSRMRTRKHIEVAQLRRMFRLWPPSMQRVSELWLECWRKSDLPPDQIKQAAIASSMAVYGLVNEDSVLHRGLDEVPDLTVSGERSLSEFLAEEAEVDRVFEFTVRAMIDGVYARACAEAKSEYEAAT